MKKKLLILILLCIILLTGCWDKRELNELAIVLATGIDMDPATDEMILTFQVVKPKTMQEGEGSSSTSPTKIVTARGKTLLQARKNTIKKFDRQPLVSHERIIIISERLAKTGLQTILDRLVRFNEIRPLTWLIIAKGASPEEIMTIEHGISEIQGQYLSDIVRSEKIHSEANVIYLQRFIENVLSGSINPTAGVMEVIGGNSSTSGKGVTKVKEVKLTGTAVFSKDKLIGYLTDRETLAANLTMGKAKTGTITFPSPTEKGKIIDTQIKKVKSSIKPELNNGEFVFNIKISVSSELAEQQDTSDISKPANLNLVEKAQEAAIKSEVEAVIQKLQNELRSDILGFGSALSKSYPKYWEVMKADWKDKFQDAQYTVSVDSRIARTGLLKKPMEIKK